MAKFENMDRRMPKINACLKDNGFKDLDECKEMLLQKGIDVDAIVRGVQNICFDNAVWAYTLGTAIAVKRGLSGAADCAAAGVDFFWLWNILEEALDLAEEARLRDIPAYHWEKVMIYNSRIYELLPLEERQARFHPADAIGSFSSLLSILNALSADGGLAIFAANCSNMDLESKKFLSFLSARLKKGDMELHICA